MKSFLCLLNLAGLMVFATTGCEVESHGGYYGPNEYQYGYYHHDGYYHHGYWDNGRGGYWDRGRYYYY